jgi:hypothetical protein
LRGVLSPRMEILQPPQRRLWPALAPVTALGFVLYGGTAIALRLGHRLSVDFDFFTESPLDRRSIRQSLPFIGRSTTLQDEQDSWVLNVPADDGESEMVKISFFGGITFGRVGVPDLTGDGVLMVASLADLMATKVKTVLQRAEAKDYQDIAAMIAAGVSLSQGMAAARLLFGRNFQPAESLKALVYFQDGDLDRLSTAEKAILRRAVNAVTILPEPGLLSTSLSAPGP